jgi:hypothetical protein
VELVDLDDFGGRGLRGCPWAESLQRTLAKLTRAEGRLGRVAVVLFACFVIFKPMMGDG